MWSPADAALPVRGVLVFGDLAVAGAVLAYALRALRARPAEVLRFESLQADATGARPARRFSGLRFRGRRQGGGPLLGGRLGYLLGGVGDEGGARGHLCY